VIQVVFNRMAIIAVVQHANSCSELHVIVEILPYVTKYAIMNLQNWKTSQFFPHVFVIGAMARCLA
jgi:hypothetical protein